jgi:DNA-directed RNA polymerase specialized sigma24 family protein
MGEIGGLKDDGQVQGEGEPGEDYAEHRSLLFSIAYRMTGSVSDAEDIV